MIGAEGCFAAAVGAAKEFETQLRVAKHVMKRPRDALRELAK